ncbi:auxin-responsive protein SAUR71-like [Carica papaya]|uniref:auxin-responsive protein SAUR71-like n=1 Tax=Carica papaya TaxID=3649 RepID=UPI000B8CA7CE|nr:auxin-responsive protein SAUR71-like [Carica papaya]
MDAKKQEKKKGVNHLMKKTWERCKSLGRGEKKMTSSLSLISMRKKMKSWPSMGQILPEGCMSVYVGEEKERFVIKTEWVNHRLFKILLEEAEWEYGYRSEGPLLLPCKVEVFYQVLMAIKNA